MAVWRSTNWREHLGEGGNASPELSIAVDSGRVMRQIQIIPGTHAAIWQAARDFIGYAELATSGGVRWVSRITPHAFPPAPWLYCTSFPRSEGIAFAAKTDDAAEYQISKHTLNYQTLTYNVVPDDEMIRGLGDMPDEGTALATGWEYSRYVTKSTKPSAKLLVLNRGVMQGVKADVEGAAKPLLEGVPFVEACAQVEYTWHGVPAACVPDILHLTVLGTVNDATFDRYPAETLRLESIEPKASRDPFGNRIYDITYKMQFLPRAGWTLAESGAVGMGGAWVSEPVESRVAPTARGHNWFYATHRNEFIVMRYSANGEATGVPPFRRQNFAALFRPDQP